MIFMPIKYSQSHEKPFESKRKATSVVVELDFYDLVGEKSQRRKMNLLIRSDDEDVVECSDFY